MSEVTKCQKKRKMSVGEKTGRECECVCVSELVSEGVSAIWGWVGVSSKRFFTMREQKKREKKIQKTCCIVDAVCCKMLNLFFFL